MRWKRILFLAFGHMASDLYPGMLAPLLPLLTSRYGWSLAQAGFLVMVMQIFANVAQPVVGILNDRKPLRWFLWAGPLVSAVPFAFLLSVHRFDLLIVLLSIVGFGVSMFHPVGAVAAGHIAHENRRGISMALFSSGGSVGVTLAPLAVVLVVNVLGERTMPIVVFPALVMAVYFIRDKQIVVSEHQPLDMKEMFASLMGSRRELFMLWLVSTFRAMVYSLVQAFLPMLAIERGATFSQSAYYLSAMLLAGMVGLFIGGHLSDKYGRRRIMAITMIAASPLFYAFLYTTGVISTVLLLLGMLLLSSTIPVNIIMAQRVAPRLAGMASSLVMGVSFMMGGLAAPPFGALADKIGIQAAMNVIFLFPLLGGITVFWLRKE
ncbi:MFS transporter [bacterium]|nr:MFS transporter [bacterium]